MRGAPLLRVATIHAVELSSSDKPLQRQAAELMPIYFFAAGNDSAEPNELENRIRKAIPELTKVDSIEKLVSELPKKKTSTEMRNGAYVIYPISHQFNASVDK